MATTPVTRSTDLARNYNVEIDTATYPASSYNALVGKAEAKLVRELRTVSDETFEDDGAMREASTGSNYRVEAKIKNSTNLAGTSRNAVHAFLRARFEAVANGGSVAANEFGIRIYHKDGLSGEAWEGRVYVKTWTGEAATANQDEITLVLQGQGPLATITNPASSQLPVVEDLEPATGDEAGGELINIYGHHFTGATDVDFASDAADFTIVSDSHIVAVAPPHAAGSVQVKVTTPAGASANTALDDYVYTA